MIWWNPYTWKREPKPPVTWVLVTPDEPYVGLAEFSDAKEPPFRPAIGIRGLALEQAQAYLTGKVIHWAKVESGTRELLEDGRLLLMNLKDFKNLLKG